MHFCISTCYSCQQSRICSRWMTFIFHSDRFREPSLQYSKHFPSRPSRQTSRFGAYDCFKKVPSIPGRYRASILICLGLYAAIVGYSVVGVLLSGVAGGGGAGGRGQRGHLGWDREVYGSSLVRTCTSFSDEHGWKMGLMQDQQSTIIYGP